MKKKINFIHLHLHTDYSLLDGLIRIPKLVERAKEFSMPAVAMTDHGNLLGLYPFWSECRKQGIKPIIGCEVYVAPKHRKDKQTAEGKKPPYHLILLAATQEGYHNLVKLVSLGHLEGFYRKPRVDRELLEKYHKGIIALSACVSGEIPRLLLNNQYDKAVEVVKYYQDLFGKHNFFIELQRNGYELQTKANPLLLKLAKEAGAPIVATCDAHFLDKEDWKLQEIVWAIADGKRLDDETRRKTHGDEFYFKSTEEMLELFKDLPEAIENTEKIASRIEDITIEFDRIIPKYWGDLKGKTPQEVLREQTYKGAKEKYKQITDELKKRIDYELEIIHKKGYDDYFLIVGDLMRWARSKGIEVGVRGSAGGSVVAYCLDIINIEPIGWNCYFERFLNPERPSPPDIDMDFQDNRRDEVIEYVKSKYGDGFCAICAIGRLKTKAAIKDVGRVMGIELSLVEKLSKMVHVKFGKVKPIMKMMEDDKEFADIVNSDKRLQELVKYVEKIEGMARHISTHACGFLITPKPIIEYIPIQKETGSRERIITQIEGEQLEALGFMKFDFLGLRNLTIIHNTLQLINKNKKDSEKLTTKKIPLDDKKTFETFSQGKTTGVFQFESSGMKKYLKELKPSSLEDICFMAAAYRPGPMKYISGYIDCKYGRKKPEYLIPELEPIVGITYGYAIYQEQIIKICVDIAGYSMGAADMLRRAMGKKKLHIMKQEEPRFKKGVMAKGYSKEVADKLWEYLLPFADYGFNKAHAAGYALIAYWTAYLKTHFPCEFMAGLIQSDIDDIDRLAVDIDEAEQLGIKILPPSINYSDIGFRIVEYIDNDGQKKKAIRFGLKGIKNFGHNIAEAIIKEREKNGLFKNFEDFLLRVKHKDLNKKAIEALAKAGALSEFYDVGLILHNIDRILKFIKDEQNRSASAQVSLFGNIENFKPKLILEQAGAISEKQKLMWEKEFLGYYISGHPFKKIEKAFNGLTLKYSELSNYNDQYIKIIGQVHSIKKITTRKGDPMLFVKLENTKETLEVVVFPKLYMENPNIWKEDIPLLLEGKVNCDGSEVSFIANKVIEITDANISDLVNNFYGLNYNKPIFYKTSTLSKDLYLEFNEKPNNELLLRIKNLLEENKGNSSVFLKIGNKKIKTSLRVKIQSPLVKKLKAFVDKVYIQ